MDKKQISKSMTPKIVGVCQSCNKEVYNNQLFVDFNRNVYHFYCYNNRNK